MPQLRDYELFISHSWTYSDAYESLTAKLNEFPNFAWSDHSVPKKDPIHTNGTDKELYEAIYRKIIGCSCVLILAGVYAIYSKWIDKEIEISKKLNKPIIAIEPWGAERTSNKVKDSADVVVSFYSSSIISAIREYSI